MLNPVLDQERLAFLVARRASTKTTMPLPAWPRPHKELPLVSVEVKWVRFSTLNHRTKSEQMRIIEQRHRPDLFTSDPMGTEAQDEQFAILESQEGFAEIKDDLRERGQQQPAVITAEGILINGNRRAAALRSLFVNDNHSPSRYIQCLVLPADATIIELVDLETELQIAREFKEDYTWVNEAFLIEEIFDREGKSWDKVASRMHKDISSVRVQYEKLQQLHQLIALSNGTRHHADFVSNETAFTELASHIKGKPAEESASVRAAYFLGTLTGVNYRTLRHLRRADASALVRSEIAADRAIEPLLRVVAEEAGGPDLLDEVLGANDDTSTNDLTPVLSYFARQGGNREVQIDGTAVPISDLIQSVKSAIDNAAEEASNLTGDVEALKAPIDFLSSAIKILNKVPVALQKARALDKWDEALFDERLKQLEAIVLRLRDDK
ncbi:hypothetical protein [Pararhizobium sp.]|uniref:hypothetical protein n=1 Tax=Pararhizobium sp. TaxID=1977563 RepID=UPI003D0A248C